MRRSLTWLAGATLVLVACGGDSGASEAFCDNLASVEQAFADLSSAPPGDDFQSAVDNLAEIDPPAEIDDAYQEMVDAYSSIADAGSVTDPDIAGTLADAQAATAEIDSFVTQECGSSDDG
ncbi:MAG: hypothetical protein ACRD0U_07240 [Acidimicrobiales bacterium]